MSIHYSDYLQLQKILDAQMPESARQGEPAHDEMLFIIIHQAYELWFKQLIYEIDSVLVIMKKPAINDNSPELQTVVHRCQRIVSILKLLVQQIDIMETMTPMDFLDFRDLLRPASGFQSWQFKLMEAKLGLGFDQRHGQHYYTSQLRPHEVDAIRKGEGEISLLQLINNWLERMPFFSEATNWQHYKPLDGAAGKFRSNQPSTRNDQGLPSAGQSSANGNSAVEDWSSAAGDIQPGAGPVGEMFWRDYREIYKSGLAQPESANLVAFDQVFGFTEHPAPSPIEQGHKPESHPVTFRGLSTEASRAALFIMLYRGYPMLQTPFQLLNSLLGIDEQMSTWRYRHMSMVHRTIGTRMGTGGSTGRDYLKGALDKHYIFADIARMTSFLIERRKLPRLSPEMENRLGFFNTDVV